MVDLLRQLLAWFDAPSASISLAQLQDLGADALEKLQKLKLIEPTSMATRLTCPECDSGHVETVTDLNEDGIRFSFITCPEAGIVRIDATALERWTVSHELLAERLASEFGGSSTSLLDGRVWRVGAHELSGKRREVLLARGLRWPEHADCVARVRRAGRAIILVSCEVPPVDHWTGQPPVVVALDRILNWASSGPSLDRMLLKNLIDEAEEVARHATVLVDQQTLTKVVDRAVAKRAPRRPDEETLLEVVRRTESLDEAVERLGAQGIKTSRSSLDRLVQKHHGIDAVRGARSTRSFDLPVPSQEWDGNADLEEDDK